jgi:hypothetical protein
VEVVVPSEATLGAEAPPPHAPTNRATTTTKVPTAPKLASVPEVPNVALGHRRLARPPAERSVGTVPLSPALLKSGAPGGR